MPIFLQVTQYAGFIITELTNMLLLWLILTKSNNRFGSYKYVMMSYALFAMVYAVVEILTQPIVHTSGACLIVYVDSFLKFEKTVSHHLVTLYCATFGLCCLLLATHFVYRFVAICRPQNMQCFEGLNLLLFYTIPFSISILWYLDVHYWMSMSSLKTEFMRVAVFETYEDDTARLGYISAFYYYTNSSGQVVINWLDFLASFLVCAIMQILILTMIICGWKTYQKMGSVGETMSKKTKELNSQLFKTLVLQTLIPLCTMFLPVGSLLVLPMFSIEIGRLGNLSTLYASFYPAVDALIVIFMIRDFRNTVLCRKSDKKSRVTPAQRSSNYTSGD